MNAQHNRVVITIPLFMVLIIDAMGFSLIFPLIGYLILEPQNSLLLSNASLTVRELYYGITTGSFFIAVLFGSPLFGGLSDRLGRKKIILLCLLGTSFAYIVSYAGIVFHSINLFILGRLIAGFLAGSQSIAQAIIIDISPPEKKTTNLAMITLASCLGWSTGPIISGIFSSPQIMGQFNTTTPFIVAAFLPLLNFAWLYIFFKETHTPSSKSLPLGSQMALSMLKKALFYPQLRIWIVALLIIELTFAAYYELVSMEMIENLHYTPLKLGIYNTYMGLIFCFALLVLIGPALRVLRSSTLTSAGLMLAGLSIIISQWWPPEISYWLFLVPTVTAVGLSYACLMSLFSDAVGENEQGWSMGVAESVCSIGWLLASCIASSASWLSIPIIFVIIGSLSCITGVFTLVQMTQQGTNTRIANEA